MHHGDGAAGPRSRVVRAFALFLARGGSHGQDLDDWLRAERELRVESPGRQTTESGSHHE